MKGNRIVCVGLDMYTEWKEIELYVLVWTCTENGRKYNCMCWFGHVQRVEENRIVCWFGHVHKIKENIIVCVGLDM